ncbi:MAG: hypothetical protein ABGX29_03890 [Candidatus Poseidoniia archaeon]|nr:hypothetical protein [Planctomycetota bacterium]
MTESQEFLGLSPELEQLGVPQFGWFDGILEGRTQDSPTIRGIVAQINDLNLVKTDLEIQGSKFSLLMGSEHLSRMDKVVVRLEALLKLLQQLCDASGESCTIESTLRCVLIFDQSTLEVLMAPVNGTMKAIGRTRPVSEEDRARCAIQTPLKDSISRIGARRAIIIGVLFVVLFGIYALQGDYIDRLFHMSAESLIVETGEFNGLLVMEVDESSGFYIAKISRGDQFPTDPMSAQLLSETADTITEKMAVNLVVNGSKIYLQLLDEEGAIIAAEGVELRALVISEDAHVEAKIRARLRAHRLRLALDKN